jgi:SAM-dependent MidA family methyltransferase
VLNELHERIAGEIRDRGAITFARFMELALYCPNCGYYEREEDIIGRRGDYYTSVSVGSLFGELLAFQFAEWLRQDGMRIVEAGAHGGDLARDILGWMREYRPGVYARLEYWIVEPSEARQRWQRQKLAGHGSKVRWIKNLQGLTGGNSSQPLGSRADGLRGIVFSNEFLDALPVHRLGWDAKARAWFEWGVTLHAGRFVWSRIPQGASGHSRQEPSVAFPLAHFQLSAADGLLEALPDGFTVELCPAAEQWWREVAVVPGCDKLVAIDYGLTAEEFLAPERKEGTVRSYYHHRLSGDVLANPGEQDITAHVNFTAIKAAGESAGLKTEAFLTQAQLLTGVAAHTWEDESVFGKWTAERIRQFQTLTHPEHLGRAFRALVQTRE